MIIIEYLFTLIMLSNQAIEEYQKIFKEEFGQEITTAEAEEQGTRLLKFFETLIEIDQKQKQIKHKTS